MGLLTYIAFLIINGDEAYAGITGDVLSSPRDINLRSSFVKETQSVARGVAHRFQLLPLTFTNYYERKKIQNAKLEDFIFLFSALNTKLETKSNCFHQPLVMKFERQCKIAPVLISFDNDS